MISYLILLVFVGVVIRAMATSKHGGASEKELAELRERMLRLEQSMETMGADMERVSEGHRFLTALLEDRARSQLPSKAPPEPPAAG